MTDAESTRSTFAVILPAAGRSMRFRKSRRQNKLYADLGGAPVWLRSLEPFLGRDDVVQRIVAVSPESLELFNSRFAEQIATAELTVVAGGDERFVTIGRALEAVSEDIDFVAVHDGARPLLTRVGADVLFQHAQQHGSAVPVVPISSTIKRVGGDGRILETVPREGLATAQTPQIFCREELLDAYERNILSTPTDDAEIVAAAGYPVSTAPGSPMNIKITTGEDYDLAVSLFEQSQRTT